MANVYSQLLWGHGTVGSPGTYNSPPVPAGYVWVIRSITLGTGDGFFGFPGYTYFQDSNGYPIWGVTPPELTGFTFYTYDGHQVLNAGVEIQCITTDNQARWRISGYALTLP